MLKNRLVYLRKNKNKTQEKVAKIIGVTRPAYTAYERGHRSPDYEILEALADYFEVSTDYLLGRTNNPNPHNEGFNSLEGIRKIIEQLGIKDLAFYDIDEWKNFTKEDVEDIKKHFEFIAHKAKARK